MQTRRIPSFIGWANWAKKTDSYLQGFKEHSKYWNYQEYFLQNNYIEDSFLSRYSLINHISLHIREANTCLCFYVFHLQILNHLVMKNSLKHLVQSSISLFSVIHVMYNWLYEDAVLSALVSSSTVALWYAVLILWGNIQITYKYLNLVLQT